MPPSDVRTGWGVRSFVLGQRETNLLRLPPSTHTQRHSIIIASKTTSEGERGEKCNKKTTTTGKERKKKKKKTTSKRQQQVININGGLIYEPAEGVYSFHPKGEKTRTDLCKYRSPLLLSFLRLFSLFLSFFLSVYCIFTCREPVA